MERSTRAGASTKHGLIADTLSAEIHGGKFKIGDRLPSEPDLSLRFGVSRHTVRAALRSLQALGMVSSQQGVGTTVQQTRRQTFYSHAFSSAQDLLQFAASTRVRIIDTTEFAVDESRAEQFGCKPGEHWWRLRTVRAEPESGSIVAYSEIHIPLVYGSVLKDAGRSRQPIFALIERQFRETITEIRQEITCVAAVTRDEAVHLTVAPRSAAMQITRTYLGSGGRVLEIARSLHPSDIFNYSMRLRLRRGL